MIIVVCSQLFGEVISLVNLHGGVISPVSIIALPIFLISSMALIKYLYKVTVEQNASGSDNYSVYSQHTEHH